MIDARRLEATQAWRQVAECWRRLDGPAVFTIREYGAGGGALAAALLAGLRNEEPGAYRAASYDPVELNPWRIAELRERLERDDLGDRLGSGAGSAVGSASGSSLATGPRRDTGPHRAIGSAVGPRRG